MDVLSDSPQEDITRNTEIIYFFLKKVGPKNFEAWGLPKIFGRPQRWTKVRKQKSWDGQKSWLIFFFQNFKIR
jgi:hypothetical protein